MKTINRISLITAIVIFLGRLFTSQAYAQQIFDIKGAGARAAGMGYAFIGVADDATASSWNPAGLTQLDNLDISFVADYMFNDKMKYDYYNSESTLNYNIEEKLTLNYGSVVYPFTLQNENKFALGLSVQNYMNYKWAYHQQNDNYYYSSRYNKNIIYAATASLAYSPINILSLGMSLNYYFSIGNEIGGVYYNSPDDNYIREYEGYKGMNFNVGALLNFKEAGVSGVPLKIGVRIATPYELESKVTPTLFEYGSITTGWEMPLIAGAGGSYLFGDNLTISIDYDYRFLKNKNSYYYGNIYDYPYRANTNFPYDLDEWYLFENTKEQSKSSIVTTNENIGQFRVGAEYNLPLKQFYIPIRAGFKSGPTTEPNVLPDGGYGKLATNSTVHLGAGIQTSFFSFDIAFYNSAYTQKNEEIEEEGDTGQYNFTSSNSNFIASLVIFIGRKNVGDENLDF